MFGSIAARFGWATALCVACGAAERTPSPGSGGTVSKGEGGALSGGSNSGGALHAGGGAIARGGASTGGSASGGKATGGSAGGDISGGAGGIPPIVDESCLITSVMAPGSSSERRGYRRVTFDAKAQILTWEHSDDPDISNVRSRVRRLVNDEGQALVQTGESFSNNATWRFDTLRDSAGNMVESMATYTTDFDFSVTPPPPHYSWSHYTHAYDAAGSLTNTLATDVGVLDSRDFAEDAQGRCSTIERTIGDSETRLETRNYDGNRVLNVRGILTNGSGSYESVTEYRYDQQGRLLGYEYDGPSGGFSIQTADGVPDSTASYEYADDGSVTITSFSSQSDLASDQEHLWQLSPPCAEIWGALPKPAGAKCRFSIESLVPSVLDLLE